MTRPTRRGPRSSVRRRLGVVVLAAGLVSGACSDDVTPERSHAAVAASSTVPTATPDTGGADTAGPASDGPAASEPMASAPAAAGTVRPDWLGTRVLPLRPDGLGEVQPTPSELVDRAFPTIDVLPPPTEMTFTPTVAAVPDGVVARSTWTESCPVALADLRYVTLPFWGFEGDLHTGELVVNADAVDAVLAGFAVLFERRFPIEEMRITTMADLDAPATGDGNTTSAFVCRPSVGSTSFSQHAYGRAVDINPFQNPYVKGDIVLPELASAFVDRTVIRPGMLTEDDVAGFLDAGWGWGGRWTSLLDPMHLSANGR